MSTKKAAKATNAAKTTKQPKTTTPAIVTVEVKTSKALGPRPSPLAFIPTVSAKTGSLISSITAGARVAHYVLGAGRTPTGRPSFDVADAVAGLLRGKTTDELFAIGAEKTGLTESDLRSRYSHLNPGQIRMNIGNRLRSALKASSTETK